MTTRRAIATGGTARGFWWQGALILLPVLALAGAGVWALHRDRRIAEEQLAERAQVLADEAARRVLAHLFPFENGNPLLPDSWVWPPRTTSDKYPPLTTNIIHFVISKPVLVTHGNPLLPIPQAIVTTQLTADQAHLWQCRSTLNERNGQPPGEWLREFINSNPPAEFVARAEYEAAVALLGHGQTNSAMQGFERVQALAGDIKTETGLPLRHLAQLHLLALYSYNQIELIREEWISLREKHLLSIQSQEALRQIEAGRLVIDPGGDIHPWLDDAMYKQPSPVTDWLVEAADRHGVVLRRYKPEFTHRFLWDIERRKLALAAATYQKMQAGPLPHLFRLIAEDRFLVTRQVVRPEATNRSDMFYALAEKTELKVIHQALSGLKGVPNYLDFQVEVAGISVNPNPQAQRLAVSEPISLVPELRVVAIVTDAAAFRAAIRQRTLWYDGLVGVACLAAFIGLFAAWRAFLRQQRLAEMKSNFVSSVSHELRAPIASVRLMAEGLESGKIAEASKQQEYFRFISQECRRLSALIENVLDFARIEQGRKQYELEPTDAVALVKATLQLLEPVAREKGVTLQIEMDEVGLAAVQPQWDGRAMQQALINLLDNAIKYSPKDARVTVGLVQQDTALIMSVADEGVGIPAAEQEKIFERFYRVGSEMRREAQGVGIGLSLVKHIVEAHDGRVTVRSAPGQGSCFTMELPVCREGMKGAQ